MQTSAGDVDVGGLTAVLAHAALSDDDAIRLTALRWLRTFVLDARSALLPQYALVLSAVLPALAAGPPEVVQARAARAPNRRRQGCVWAGRGALCAAPLRALRRRCRDSRDAAVYQCYAIYAGGVPR